MADTFRSVSTTSYGGRIKNAIAGILFGIALFIGSFVLLWWNEGRYVESYIGLKEAEEVYVPVEGTTRYPENNGNLVYVSGLADTSEVLTDDLTKIRQNAMGIEREVLMYQWEEDEKTTTKTNTGGSETKTTTYTYKKVWAKGLNRSSSFNHREGHENPEMAEYKGAYIGAKTVSLGDYLLNSTQIKKVSKTRMYSISQDDFDALPMDLRNKAQLSNGVIYVGSSPANPQIGDYKISIKVAPAQTDVSLLAQQNNYTFVPYVAKNGKNISLIKADSVSADELLQDAHNQNKMVLWACRLGGFLMMWIGLGMIVSVFRVVASFIPFMGSLVGFGLGFINFLLSLALSSITIAIAWIFYRPLIGGLILAVAAALIFMASKKFKHKKKKHAESNSSSSEIETDTHNSVKPQPVTSKPVETVEESKPKQSSNMNDGFSI